jgi:hypothetical protein
MPRPPAALPGELLEQLTDLIDRLRRETGGCFEQPGDQQQWYNRGYANGMVLALIALDQHEALAGRAADEAAVVETAVGLPWGKAYRHGESTGRRETYEIAGIQPS